MPAWNNRICTFNLRAWGASKFSLFDDRQSLSLTCWTRYFVLWMTNEIVENSKNAHKIDHRNIMCIFDVFLLVLAIHRRHRITISQFQYDDVQNYVRVCWSQLLSVFLFEAKCFVIWRLGLVRGEGNFTLSSHHSVSLTSPNGEDCCLPSPKLHQKKSGIVLRQFWRGQNCIKKILEFIWGNFGEDNPRNFFCEWWEERVILPSPLTTQGRPRVVRGTVCPLFFLEF